MDLEKLKHIIKCDGELHDRKKIIFYDNDVYEYDYDLDVITYIKDNDQSKRINLCKLYEQIQNILSEADDWNSSINQIY